MKGCRSLNDEEIVQVLGILKNSRDRLLLTLGLKCGMRISELLSLRLQDVMEHGEIGTRVNVAKKNTKGKVESRSLPLTESVKVVLKEYLNTLTDKDPNQPLFKSSQSNKAIGRMQAHTILKDAFKALKLPGKLATHALRKTYCDRVHKALGERIEMTQVAMGHKSISSTQNYIQVNREEVENAILGLG